MAGANTLAAHVFSSEQSTSSGDDLVGIVQRSRRTSCSVTGWTADISCPQCGRAANTRLYLRWPITYFVA